MSHQVDELEIRPASTPSRSYTTDEAERHKWDDPEPEVEQPLVYSQERQSRISRFARPFRPATRRLRWLLGPSQPLPKSLLPQPSLSCTLSFSGPKSSHTICPDLQLLSIQRRARLTRFVLPFILVWLTGFVLLVRQQWYPPGAPPIIGCTSALWDDWPPDVCGVNGTDCTEYLEAGEYRCLGGCQDVTLGNPRFVGDQEVNKVPLIIGGEDRTYRADSWVCAAAIHSGLISAKLGGCVSLTTLLYPTGSSNFPSLTAHGLTSASFLPPFPAAYTISGISRSGCLDIHPFVTAYNAGGLFLTTILFNPPAWMLMLILVVVGHLHLNIISDPPYAPPSWSYTIGGLIPVMIAGYWMYKVAFHRTISGFRKLPFELGFWQGAGYWIGLESSTIFAKLPISRLGYDSLDPAGIICLLIIIICVIIVVVIQAWTMREVGLLQYYILRYLPLVPILIILANLGHGYVLRLHHYILALIAIPVLSLPNRVSLFLQAFMLGLFLDGVGRWGWANIVESTASLLGDANAGTYTPQFTVSNSSSAVSWADLNDTLLNLGFTGFSLIVDDIQRLFNVSDTNVPLERFDLTEGVAHYFRLAYVANGTSLDYVDPITRWANGTWSG